MELFNENTFYELLLMAEKAIKIKPINPKEAMKLFFCLKCADIQRLYYNTRTCKCGSSSAKYIDNKNAVYEGENCIPLGFVNQDFIKAVKMAQIENKHQHEKTTCSGVDFRSFVMLNCTESIQKKPSKKQEKLTIKSAKKKREKKPENKLSKPLK